MGSNPKKLKEKTEYFTSQAHLPQTFTSPRMQQSEHIRNNPNNKNASDTKNKCFEKEKIEVDKNKSPISQKRIEMSSPKILNNNYSQSSKIIHTSECYSYKRYIDYPTYQEAQKNANKSKK